MVATPPAYPASDASGAERHWPTIVLPDVVEPPNPFASWSHAHLERELKRARERRDKASKRCEHFETESRARLARRLAVATWQSACEAYDRLAAELRRRASAPGVP